MARKHGNYGIGAARKGSTKIQSYEEKGGFNSAGHKRQGSTKYTDRPDAPGAPAAYTGGTCPGDSGLTPS